MIAPEYVTDEPVSSNLATFQYAAYLIANCPKFQELCEVHSAAEALLRIHIQESLADSHPDLNAENEGDEPPEIQDRPMCILLDSSRTRRKVAHQVFAAEGVLIAAFEVLVPDDLKYDFKQDGVEVIEDKFRRRKKWRINAAGGIEDNILGQEGIPGLAGRHDPDGNPFLNVVDTDQIMPPSDPDSGRVENWVGFALALTWK